MIDIKNIQNAVNIDIKLSEGDKSFLRCVSRYGWETIRKIRNTVILYDKNGEKAFLSLMLIETKLEGLKENETYLIKYLLGENEEL